MGVFSWKVKGKLRKTRKFLKHVSQIDLYGIMEKYAQLGVEYLRAYTPADSGTTAECWGYEIDIDADHASIHWTNNNTNDNVIIALLLQYGHGTGTGGWVEGVDYINPALRPVFDGIMSELWKEVTK